MKNLQNQRGSTLPLVIILLAVLAISSAQALTTMSNNSKFIASGDYGSQTHQLAKSGTIAYTHFVLQNQNSMGTLLNEEVTIEVNNPPANFEPVQTVELQGTDNGDGTFSDITIQMDTAYKSAADTVKLALKAMASTSDSTDIFTNTVYAGSFISATGTAEYIGPLQSGGSITFPHYYPTYPFPLVEDTPITTPVIPVPTVATEGLSTATTMGRTNTNISTGNGTQNYNTTQVILANKFTFGSSGTANVATTHNNKVMINATTVDFGGSKTINLGYVGRTEPIIIVCDTLKIGGSAKLNFLSPVEFYVRDSVDIAGGSMASPVYEKDEFGATAQLPASIGTFNGSTAVPRVDLVNFYLGRTNIGATAYSNTPSIDINGSADFAGFVYGPTATGRVTGNGEVYGAMILGTMSTTGSSTVMYDPTYGVNNHELLQVQNITGYVFDRYIE